MIDFSVLGLNPCAETRQHLDAFADGELPGHLRLAVARHIETCASCAAELDAVAAVGNLLRSVSVPEAAIDERLAGLGPRVVGRVRAEERFSWRTQVVDTIDGWRWTIVGAGSVAGTFATTAILLLILAFGPTPVRDDSLQALMGNLASPPGYLFLEIGELDGEEQSELLQVRNGQPRASRSVTELAAPGSSRTEMDVVVELADAVTRNGRVVSLGAMDQPTRERTEALFRELTRINQRRRQAGTLERTLNVRGVRLVTSVTAKG